MVPHLGFILGLIMGLTYITIAIGVWKSAGGHKLQKEDKLLCFIVSVGWVFTLPLFVVIMVMDVASSWFGEKVSKGFEALSSWKERNS